MNTLYDVNGLVFWSSEEIKFRNYIKEVFADRIKTILSAENKGWSYFEIEAPLLIPRDLINKNYENNDVWVQETKDNDKEMVLRPETTPSSYIYAQHMINSYLALPPFVVYQTGKSFRREQDQVSKNMRLKEFYQQEFQCIYASDTLNDYQEKVLEPIRMLMEKIIGKPARLVDSDRLPSYSVRTMDVEVDNGDKWMEVCSISKRTDFPQKVKFNSKALVEKEMLVLEIAIGLDRCVYNYFK